jgi:hypothetical protein
MDLQGPVHLAKKKKITKIFPFLDNSCGMLLPFLATDQNYHNSGPEKMRTANSKFFSVAKLINSSGSTT